MMNMIIIVIKVKYQFLIYFLLFVFSPLAEGNKEPEGEDDDNAAAVKIQVIKFLF